MRVCILTLPLLNNYGGILQAYALQVALKRKGHDVWTENRQWPKVGVLEKIRMAIRKLIGLIPLQHKFGRRYYPSEQESAIIAQHTRAFISKYINTTVPISTADKALLEPYHFDAFVVGSDQVWRPKYTPKLENYFLDFAADADVKRLAYAASFGTDQWEFDSVQTVRCAALIKKFDAVSVREISGVKLCEEKLGITADFVLDPTMLLDQQDYASLVEQEKEPPCEGNLFTYILDKTSQKSDLVKHVSGTLQMKPFEVMPEKSYSRVGEKYLHQCIYPSVTKWLRAFMDAEMVITDSFHGTVFSIIFNKPFWVIGNSERGLARFHSLLSIFGLESRMISSDYDKVNWKAPIDWSSVNPIRTQWKEKSFSFLNQILAK